MSNDEQQYERAQWAIQDAIEAAAEAGMSIEVVREEVDDAIQTLADDGAFGPAAEVRD